MATPQLVIFDMDGLMFDTENLAMQCWVESGKRLGVPVTESVILETLGRNILDSEKIMLGHYQHLEHYNFQTLKEGHEQLVSDWVHEKGTPHKPGLIDLLDHLENQKIRKAVVTSSFQDFGEMLLKGGGVLHRFDAIVYGDMVTHGKPAPDGFLKAAELLNAKPEACLVLEDSPAGVRAAGAAGIPVAFIPDLATPDEETIALATYFLRSLEEVLPLL